MWIGIDQSTDRRRPEPVIRRFRTEAAARRWLRSPRETLVDPASADPALPIGQQNFHRRIRTVYLLPPGFRPTRQQLARYERDGHRWRSRMECLALAAYAAAIGCLRADGSLERRP